MGKDQEESVNPDEKIGIRTRIRDKFKTIAAETKAIKERNHPLAILFHSSFFKTLFSKRHFLKWYFVHSIFRYPAKKMSFTGNI